MLLHPLSLPVLCIILICALLTVLQLFFLRKQSIARFRVIFPRKADRIAGFLGGIELHAANHVSLTHSSESSLSYRTFQAILKQYLLYFSSVACMAFSDLSKYRLIITVSSTFFTSRFFYFAFIR